MAADDLTSKGTPVSTSCHFPMRGIDGPGTFSLFAFRRQPPPVRFDHACLGSESMPMEFDTPFDRWLRAHDIRPRRLARGADVSRPTVLRIRKGSLGRAATRAKLAATCSTIVGRRVTESELFWIGSR